MKVGINMENNKVKEIMELDRKIEDIALKTTSYYSPNETQELNNYDSKVMELYQIILDLIIKIAKDEKTKDIATIDEKYFIVENTASMMIESYISILQFYGNIDRRITKKEIQVISQIQENLTLDDNFEMKNKIELAEANNHILFTDFGYDRLVKFYDNIGDTKNKQKYQELYDKWKNNRDAIQF